MGSASWRAFCSNLNIFDFSRFSKIRKVAKKFLGFDFKYPPPGGGRVSGAS